MGDSLQALLGEVLGLGELPSVVTYGDSQAAIAIIRQPDGPRRTIETEILCLTGKISVGNVADLSPGGVEADRRLPYKIHCSEGVMAKVQELHQHGGRWGECHDLEGRLHGDGERWWG